MCAEMLTSLGNLLLHQNKSCANLCHFYIKLYVFFSGFALVIYIDFLTTLFFVCLLFFMYLLSFVNLCLHVVAVYVIGHLTVDLTH
jgi:hypothetical protein